MAKNSDASPRLVLVARLDHIYHGQFLLARTAKRYRRRGGTAGCTRALACLAITGAFFGRCMVRLRAPELPVLRRMNTAYRTSGGMSRETRLIQRAPTPSKAERAPQRPYPPPFSLKTSQTSEESPVHRARHNCVLTTLSPCQTNPPPSLHISTSRKCENSHSVQVS